MLSETLATDPDNTHNPNAITFRLTRWGVAGTRVIGTTPMHQIASLRALATHTRNMNERRTDPAFQPEALQPLDQRIRCRAIKRPAHVLAIDRALACRVSRYAKWLE